MGTDITLVRVEQYRHLCLDYIGGAEKVGIPAIFINAKVWGGVAMLPLDA